MSGQMIGIEQLKKHIEDGQPLSSLIEVKKTVSLDQKKVFIDLIVASSIKRDESGLLKIDYFMNHIAKYYAVIRVFSNIDLDSTEDNLETYNYLFDNKVIEYITREVDQGDLDLIFSISNDEIQQKVKMGNSLANIINDKLEVLLEKIPDREEINSIINNLDPVKLNAIKSFNDSLKLNEVV